MTFEQIMEWVTTVLLPFLASSGLGTFISWAVVKGVLKKNSTAGLAQETATAVVNSVVGKGVKVSLESVNKAQFNALKNELKDTWANYVATQNAQSKLLIGIGKVMLRFKSASESEKAEIANAMSEISQEKIEAPVEDAIVVTIDKVETKETSTDLNLF